MYHSSKYFCIIFFRLLDLGFEKDISSIIRILDEKKTDRQTVLVSATLSAGKSPDLVSSGKRRDCSTRSSGCPVEIIKVPTNFQYVAHSMFTSAYSEIASLIFFHSSAIFQMHGYWNYLEEFSIHFIKKYTLCLG